MNKGRLEAFSDGVFAIIITIMVLDLRVPSGPSLEALRSMVPVFLSYVLSFVYVGIYWNNHHHLLHASERVSGPILWANLHLLFWLSLAPFATRWVGENYNAPVADRALWCDAAIGGCCVFHPDQGACRPSRSVITIGDLDWKRSQRACQRHHLRDRDSSCVRLAEGGLRLLRICCIDVARAGPADRKTSDVKPSRGAFSFRRNFPV